MIRKLGHKFISELEHLLNEEPSAFLDILAFFLLQGQDAFLNWAKSFFRHLVEERFSGLALDHKVDIFHLEVLGVLFKHLDGVTHGCKLLYGIFLNLLDITQVGHNSDE